jgi:FkbM family methyltransferase
MRTPTVRRPADVPRFIAHGRNWEDVRLRRIFATQPSGFYIDVGAAHPVARSFSFSLYQQGWRGVNVEPLPKFFALLQSERPEDVNIQAVLGTSDTRNARFFEVADQRGSSTMRTDIAQELREHGVSVIEHEVPLLSLCDVCERHAPQVIDVLRVDVEGAQADVLSGGDWERFRPRLVVVEASEPESWEPLLLENGYRHAAFDGVNHWYVEEQDAHWIESLEPPVSVLDDFVPYELLETYGLPQSADDTPMRTIDSAAPGKRSNAGGSIRPRLLLVLSSANQMYSGTGRVIMETYRRLRGEFDVEFAIDDTHTQNVEVTEAFCAEHTIALHLGKGGTSPGAPDTFNEGLASLLETLEWDIVMGVSWANAATNRALLEGVGDRALAYLPLHQPSWTIPLDALGQSVVESTHRDMLRRADVVFCLTPWERRELGRLAAPVTPQCAVVLPGCDFDAFAAGAVERPLDLLFVGDHREPRKRFDRVASVLQRVRDRGLDARILIVGNESERAARSLPADVADAAVALGYVDEDRLCRVYREAAVLLLLSEYEAFGLPVIEALASVTPVVMTCQPAPMSLFGSHEGVRFVDGANLEETTDAVCELLSDGVPLRHKLLATRAELAQQYDWSVCAQHTRDHLLAAWARRRRAVGGFIAV